MPARPDGLTQRQSPCVSSASLMMRSAKRLLQLLRAVRPYRSMGSSAWRLSDLEGMDCRHHLGFHFTRRR